MRPACHCSCKRAEWDLSKPSIALQADDSFVAVNVASKTKELTTFLSRDRFFVIETEQDGTTFLRVSRFSSWYLDPAQDFTRSGPIVDYCQ
jgi:hypothetical protein